MTNQLIFQQRRRTRRRLLLRAIVVTTAINAIQIIFSFNISREFNYIVSNVEYEAKYIQKLLNNNRDDVESKIFKFLRMTNVTFKVLSK